MITPTKALALIRAYPHRFRLCFEHDAGCPVVLSSTTTMFWSLADLRRAGCSCPNVDFRLEEIPQ